MILALPAAADHKQYNTSTVDRLGPATMYDDIKKQEEFDLFGPGELLQHPAGPVNPAAATRFELLPGPAAFHALTPRTCICLLQHTASRSTIQHHCSLVC